MKRRLPERRPRPAARSFGHALTATGQGVLVAAAVLVAVGEAAGYPEVRAVGIASVAAVLLATATALFRPELSVRRDLAPTAVTRGETALGLVEVRNPSGRISTVASAIDRVGGSDVAVTLPRLHGGETRTTTYPLPTNRRGIVQVGPLRVVRTDPLGLLSAQQSYGEIATLIVHPRVLPIPVLPAGMTRSMEGPTSENAPNGNITFHALRPYVEGDDLRQVHWKSTARTGDLMVRQLVDTSQVSMGIVLDIRRRVHADEGCFEELVDVAASLSVAAADHRFPVRVYAGAETSPALRKPRDLLDWLAGVELTDDTDIPGLDAVGRTRQHDTLFVLSGKLAMEEMRRIASVRHRYATVAVVSIRPDVVIAPTPRVPGVTAFDVLSAEEAIADMQGIRW